MANEISLSFSLNVSNGELSENMSRSFNADQTTARGNCPGFLLVGTTEELVSLADLVSPGIVLIENLDAALYVMYGVQVDQGGSTATFYPVGRVLAGERYPWRMDPTCQLYLKASGANCPVILRVFDS